MSLSEAFAANLRRLCEREDSIASVCRATQINRQQFNRYLAGGALPNERNRTKICRYFKIDERTLFQSVVELNGTGIGDAAPLSNDDIVSALGLLEPAGPTSITPGTYFAYFTIPSDESSIMRSAIIVRRDGNLSTFRRITGVSELRGSWWSNFDGDHKGIILERRHWAYFVGLNRFGHREPTMLVQRWLPNSRPMLGGHAAIVTPAGPSVTAMVMHPCRGNVSLRSAIRASHVYSTTDPEIEPIVMDALDQQSEALVSQIKRLDLSVRPYP